MLLTIGIFIVMPSALLPPRTRRGARRPGAEAAGDRTKRRAGRAWHAISKTDQLNSLYNEIIEDSVMVLREENLMVGGNLITLFLNGQGYATRKVPIWSTASVGVKPEGVDFAAPTTFEKSQLASFTPTVKMSQFLLTDEMMQTDDVDSVRQKASSELGGAMAEYVDEDVLSKFTDFTTDKGTAGTAMSITIAANAISTLRGKKVRGERNAVLHPYQWHDLWIELGRPATEFAFLGDVANEALREFYVVNWMSTRWFVSANIAVDASDDAVGAVFMREALAYDQREAFDIETERDASRKADEMNASIGYATGVLRNDAGIGITTDAAEPSL
jgi:hypothetical protein